MLYVCVDSFVVSKSILFYQSSTTSWTSVASLRISNSPGNYPQKSLLSRIRKLQWGCVLFFIVFFLYPPSFSQKKFGKMMLFENYDNIPCKGWQKTVQLPGWQTTVFHLQKGSHFAVKILSDPGDFPRGGQRQGKCEFPTSLSEVQECSSFFLFVLVLSFFWLGTGTTTRTQLEAERDLFGTNGKGYIESIW